MHADKSKSDKEWSQLSHLMLAHGLNCQAQYTGNMTAREVCTSTYRDLVGGLDLSDKASLATPTNSESQDSNIHIISVATDTSKREFSQLKRSIEAANITHGGTLTFAVLGAGQSWNGTGMKCELIEDHLASLDPDTFVVRA
jgi:hypothetical protein